jgi:hypothetical protein
VSTRSEWTRSRETATIGQARIGRHRSTKFAFHNGMSLLQHSRRHCLFGGELTAAILFVRIESGLDAEEFERRLVERRPRFREVAGLVQKIYGRDDASGDVCGIYFFESEEALAAFRETDLAQTIPAAYEAVDVRREQYDVLYPLWPERGPFSVDS